MRVAPALGGFVVAVLAALAVHVCTAAALGYGLRDQPATALLIAQGIVDIAAFAVGFILGWAGIRNPGD